MWSEKLDSQVEGNRTSKSYLVSENYWSCIRTRIFRDALVRFRLGVSEIVTHKHWYCRGVSEEADINCPFCTVESEDECHFLFRRKKYSIFRPSNLKNVERVCQTNIVWRIFNNESCSASCIKQLAWFIFKKIDKRNKRVQGANTDARLKCLVIVKMGYH